MLKFLLMSCALLLASPSWAAQKARIVFPSTGDGRLVLPVDLHAHTVFSDGEIWPVTRVHEAEREGLAGLSLTDHLEWQPHRADIPNSDRNRSYAIAAASARDVIVIRGAEITRGTPPGHINTVFATDLNKLMGRNYPVRTEMPEMMKFFGQNTPENWKSLRHALETARQQGAFSFFNHPFDIIDDNGNLLAKNTELLNDGLIQGIEVVNSVFFFESGFQFALDHNLTILGTSDIHEPIDHFEWEYDPVYGLTLPNQAHRTVTLILAKEKSAASIRQALFERATVALFNEKLFGRETEVDAVLSGVLQLAIKPKTSQPDPQTLNVRISNASCIPLVLRGVGPATFINSTDIFTVPAFGFIDLGIHRPPGAHEDQALATLDVEVLSAYTSPRKHPIYSLHP